MPNSARPFMLLEANHHQLRDYKPNVAVLPWGASEAHNLHLPSGTDVIESTEVATHAAELAHAKGAKPIVLPAIPFGNNEQQLDQVATISISTRTAAAILRDVVRSLVTQKIDRLLIVNAHGGNEFKPLVRDIGSELGALIVVANFWQMRPYETDKQAETVGDHANELETSLMLHLRPQWVDMSVAGNGSRVPFAISALNQPGVWTPRPWSQSHPDTGSGDPKHGTAEKGKAFFESCSQAVAEVIIALANAKKGQLPYV